jgi:hypothetical protein
MNATETECPICDKKIQSDLMKCPNCGSDLTLSSFEDLETVANNLSTTEVQEPSEAKVVPKGAVPRSEPKIEEIKPIAPPPKKKDEPKEVAEPKKEEKTTVEPIKDEGKHGLGRLFGKKKK